MELRLLPGLPSEGMHRQHRRHLRPGSRRLRAGVASVPVKADRGRFSKVATMFARIGVMRALNRHVERVFNPDLKEGLWGRRKRARRRETVGPPFSRQ